MKLDWNASSKDKMYVRYSKQTSESGTSQTAMPLLFPSAASNPTWSVAGNWNRIFGGAIVNDLLVGYSRADNLSDEIDPLGLGKLNNRYGIPGEQTLRGLTQIQMDNTITSVGGIETGTDNFNQVYQLNERLTWLRGRHTMKFGGSWNYYRSKSYYPGNNGHNGFISYTLFNFTGYPFADFLLDQVSRKGRGFDVRRVDAPAASRRRLCRGRFQDQPEPDAESRTQVGVHVAARREGRSAGELRSHERADPSGRARRQQPRALRPVLQRLGATARVRLPQR